MVTVTVTATVYCICTVPFMIEQTLPMIIGNGTNEIQRTHVLLERMSKFLTALNIMSNFYIYSLTIPSFRQFIWSRVSTSYQSSKSWCCYSFWSRSMTSSTRKVMVDEPTMGASGISCTRL